ncbi:hypothetical protein DQ062_24880 [Salmonella enterica subsp. enterica serovar Havana]|nr:hypothetical protein [Salmonella enterica subsp. enterica serovar Havana]
MSSNSEIISEIANIISDYKHLPSFIDRTSNASVSSHVMKWVNQFSEDDKNIVLRHTHRVLSDRYFSEKDYDLKIDNIVNLKKNHQYFKSDCLLSAQSHGESQRNLNEKLNNAIENKLKIKMPVLNSSDFFVDSSRFDYINYIDDFSFSAKLVGDDVIGFIRDHGVNNAKIRIIIFVFHSYGLYALKNKLNDFIKENKLNIEFIYNHRFWLDVNNDIHPDYSCNSEVYFLEENAYKKILSANGLSDDDKYKTTVFRIGSHKDCILGDESERRKIEEIFSMKGFEIISHSELPKKSMKPLGFSTFPGVGFGGNVFSYRNCPNNTPLVFWWGTYQKTNNEAIDCWYPLMRRQGYYE